MKGECLKDTLRQAVGQTEKITAKNLSLPVLESVYIETGDNKFIVKSTNLDVGIEVSVPAKIEKKGSVAIPASLISGFLNAIPDNQIVRLEAVSGNLSVSTSKNSTLIKGFPTDDFPIIPKPEKEASFMINSTGFVEGIRSVSYSASLSEMKPEISSVYLHAGKGEIYFVSTDSFRLAEKKVNVPGVPEDLSLIIPYKNANEAARVFSDTDAVLEVGFNKNQIYIHSEDVYFTSRLFAGVFPDYRQIIPKDKKTEAVLLKKDLVDVLKLSNVFTDKFNQIDIKIDPGDGIFEINSKNQDKGENNAKIEAVLSGESISLSLNSRYISDCLGSIEDDSIAISFNGANKPVVFRGSSRKDFIYLVMPLNK